jgi:hypothetical protein
MWNSGMPLAEIAKELHYSFSTLAQLRHSLGLRKRYGHEDDEAPPTLEVIRIRCLEQQTNWTDTERKMRWRGPPHTIYSSGQGYGSEP